MNLLIFLITMKTLLKSKLWVKINNSLGIGKGKLKIFNVRFVECRLRKLIVLFDKDIMISQNLEIQPFPLLFKTHDKMYQNCESFFIGFKSKPI